MNDKQEFIKCIGASIMVDRLWYKSDVFKRELNKLGILSTILCIIKQVKMMTELN